MKQKKTIPKKNNSSGPLFYRFQLFVAGDEPNSLKARAALERLCDKHLRNRCEVRIVDVFEDYRAAIDHNIIVVPALIVKEPPPEKIIVGSLNDEERVLTALGLTDKGEQP